MNNILAEFLSVELLIMEIYSSVGMHGINKYDDVKKIQSLLVNKGYHLRIDGHCGKNTVKAIRKYQSHFISHPDALIEVGGVTFRHLIAGSLGSRPDPQLPPIQNKAFIGDGPGVKYHPSGMKLSAKGLALLKDYEQFRAMPYDDQTGKPITEFCKGATVGYGVLLSNRTFLQYKNGITLAEATSLLAVKLIDFEATVKRVITVNLSQNEYDALVIFCYNIGKELKGFPSTTVAKIVNGEANGDLDAAWMLWNKSQGKVNKGVINRRKTELRVYHNSVYVRVY
ncbi:MULTISPECIES: glycoside hydrolase family protein [unclassified Erwinia]|uniref:glycoside hydrolase family protein n=1 Tax=unclassified Erwinia TaxID=2622719 RepID=UPI00263AF5CC|nr:glycoside hydrolase family protein [Erwinia sp. PsM31]MDN4629549.1 glycoside hydrolase family protein [Erwinia sp. PsM31]